jgi:hypothetical protein
VPHAPASPLVTPLAARDMANRLNRPDYTQWAARTRALGGCAQPIHLRGSAEHIDASTGELLHRYSTAGEPGGILRVACKTRRASRCPACAEVYRADTYQLVRAGLVGGKGVPATVTEHPAAFVTLTAPSFGTVHTRRTSKAGAVLPCHPRRDAKPCPHRRVISCTARHSADDSRLGSRCVRTATTTTGRSCSTPSPPNYGDASPSPCGATSPDPRGSSSENCATC